MLHRTEIPVKTIELAEVHLTTGRHQLMDVVFRRWASLLQDRLYAKKNLMFEVSTENVKKIRFENFLSSVSKQPIYIFETQNQSRGLFLVDNTFFLKLILNTKAGITLERSSLGKLMKEHQKDLLALVQPMIEDFEKSWLNIADVELNLNRVTIYPQRAKVMLPYEYCFVGSVRLSVQDIQSEILLCLPYSGIDPLLSHLENKSVIAPESIENYSPHVKRHFMDILEKKEYSVVAELGNADLVGTKGKLEVGQLLPLLGKENLATIRINGTPVLQGYTGESDGHYSVQVTRGIEDKKPSAIQEEMAFKQVTWPSQ